jgi:hypothetical protein
MILRELSVAAQKLEGKAGRIKLAFVIIRGGRSPIGSRHSAALLNAPPPVRKHGQSLVDG